MNEFLSPSIPEFNRETFDEIIEGFVQISRLAATEASKRRKRFPRGHPTLSEGLRFAGQAKGKELTVQEIKKLAQLHSNLSGAEAKSLEIDRRLEDALARETLFDEEIAELDESLSIFEEDSGRGEYDDHSTSEQKPK
ncbi:hypothetical protein BH20ACI2_BH20ACI2_07150 [soil metagenome]